MNNNTSKDATQPIEDEDGLPSYDAPPPRTPPRSPDGKR